MERNKSIPFTFMPPQLKGAYLNVNPSQEGLLAMFNRDATRMKNFKDYS